MTSGVDAPPASAGGAPAASGGPAVPVFRRFRRGARQRNNFGALLGIAPALVLIVLVVVYPAYELVRASLSRYSITGLLQGSAGTSNYRAVLSDPSFPTVLRNTVIWVVAVVVITILLSLALAQFLVKDFFGRRVLRWAVLVPWAASLIITARLFTLLLDVSHGIVNQILLSLHLVSQPVDFLGNDHLVLPSMIAVGVFVSIPFTAYVFVAGLNAIPIDVYEAARVDGANAWKVYWHITLPLLRGPLLVASTLNIIYVFNSFPIVYTLNERNPGFSHDTSITYSYKLAFKSAEHSVGMSAAAAIFNVALILLVILVYLRLVDWKKAVTS